MNQYNARREILFTSNPFRQVDLCHLFCFRITYMFMNVLQIFHNSIFYMLERIYRLCVFRPYSFVCKCLCYIVKTYYKQLLILQYTSFQIFDTFDNNLTTILITYRWYGCVIYCARVVTWPVYWLCGRTYVIYVLYINTYMNTECLHRQNFSPSIPVNSCFIIFYLRRIRRFWFNYFFVWFVFILAWGSFSVCCPTYFHPCTIYLTNLFYLSLNRKFLSYSIHMISETIKSSIGTITNNWKTFFTFPLENIFL